MSFSIGDRVVLTGQPGEVGTVAYVGKDGWVMVRWGTPGIHRAHQPEDLEAVETVAR